MNRWTSSALILFLLALVAPLDLPADTLVLKNGNKFEGTIAEQTPDKIVLEIENGTLEFKSSDVQEIRREEKRPGPKPLDGAPAPPSLDKPKPAPETPDKAKPAPKADAAAPKPTATPASPNAWLPIYNEAKQAVMAGDLEKAKTSLEKVTVLNPDLLEAWYHLGACGSRLAIKAAQEGRDQEALALFRKAVADKKTAKKLMDKGNFVLWKNPDDQAQARSDVENALKDVDSFINDDAIVLAALRLYGAMQGK